MNTQKTALLSAYNKDGLEDFARELVSLGWNLLGSSGTVKYLADKGVNARDVSEIVGKPILGHRVVTLSREIHAALLAQDTPEDQAELDRLGIPRINLVYVDLYPLKWEIDNPSATLESVIEKTDIGGPTLLRSAAKGRRLVLSDRSQFEKVLWMLKQPDDSAADAGIIFDGLIYRAEEVVSEYCAISARYHRMHARDGVSDS